MLGVILEIVLFAVTSLLCYAVLSFPRMYWRKLGIPSANPSIPFGNLKGFILGDRHIAFDMHDVYLAFPGQRLVGFFQMYAPTLMIRDVDLARSIMTKDFHHFQDRSIETDEIVDPLSANLVNMKGYRWRSVRKAVNPAFSEERLQQAYSLIGRCVRLLDGNIKGNDVVVNVKDLFDKFALDVIGSWAFALDFGSLNDPHSEYIRVAKRVFQSSFRSVVGVAKMVGNMMCPAVVRCIRISTLPPDIVQFFQRMLQDAKIGKNAGDVTQLLMKAREEEQKLSENGAISIFTDDVLTGNMFIFFAGGFETVSTTLSFCVYELALNKDVQSKVRTEVAAVRYKNGGTIDYTAAKQLKYTEMVINETLRKYSPFSFHSRECTKLYEIPGTNIVLNVGTKIAIPAYSFHHDPLHFPHPEKFDPERFNEKNSPKSLRAFLPFGHGPRICVAHKFATIEVKCCIAEIIANFEFSTCDRTDIPINVNPRSIFYSPTQVLLRATKII